MTETFTMTSKEASLRKIIFKSADQQYYPVVGFYDSEDNSTNLCLSSQVGCTEKCKFCATGQFPLVRNLTAGEILEQISVGIQSVGDLVKDKDPRVLYLIFEGMGESSYNLNNCFQGFKNSRLTPNGFDKTVFRLSTVGNLELIEPYSQFILENRQSMPDVRFNFQVSLHSPFDEERKYLIPGISGKFKINEIIKSFGDFAEFLDSKLKLNYLLLNFPNGQRNYSPSHLEELASIVLPEKTKIKLTKYSETGKGFSSPSENVFGEVKDFLIGRGIETSVRQLIGRDINAACGMLHYQ